MEKHSDVPAERVVLAGLYQHGQDAYIDVIDFLQNETFTDITNQCLFKCFKHGFDVKKINRIDKPSLLAIAGELGIDKHFAKDDWRVVRATLNTPVNLENVRSWAAKIRKLHIIRLLSQQLKECQKDIGSLSGEEPISHVIGLAEQRIFDFSSLVCDEGTNSPSLIHEGLDEFLDKVEEDPRDNVGISSGYSHYDFAIGGGFRRKSVNMIGSRTGIGKSMLADNVGIHVAENLGIPVLYLDTEMATEDHWVRILANKASVPINEIETGKYSTNNIQKKSIRKFAEKIKEIPLHYLNVSGRPFEETISIMRRWVNKVAGFDENGNVNDCLIIYDYLKMMSGEGITPAMQEYQILGFMATTFHNFAVRNDLPILTFIQLNRDGIDKESTAAVSGSDRVVWLTSNLTIFKPKTEEEIVQDDGEENGNRKLVVIKSRHGSGLSIGNYINMYMIGKFGRIIEKETRDNLKQKTNSARSDPPKQIVVGGDEEVSMEKPDEE